MAPKVKLNVSVNLLLSTYALSNEYQEIAALLLGSTTENTVSITNCTFLQRKDKKSDRVEISSDQLMIGMQEAEELNLKVVGWMHSHPKITVLPSHVDIKTQYEFQRMDSSFVGLIYSCFHVDHNAEKLQLTAFQSAMIDGNLVQVQLPIEIVSEEGMKDPNVFKKLSLVSKTYYQEDLEDEMRDEIDSATLSLKVLRNKNAFIDPLISTLNESKV